MYGYIKGVVKKVYPGWIILENNGIGYKVIVANPYYYHAEEEKTVFTHFHVREDNQLLYGFKDEKTLDFFKKLIGVSGIGPKSALSITAADDINDVIDAIENSDITYLTRFPGIGKKSAQQIILDLKGNLVELDIKINNKQESDVKDALLALGYSKVEITKVIKKLDMTQSVELMIKQALSLLIKG